MILFQQKFDEKRKFLYSGTGSDLKGGTGFMGGILVIEDNPDNLELVRFLLEQAGYVVTGVSDGSLGLAAVRENKPDLVLLDMSLPGMDGWKVAQQIKADSQTASTLIVALTAHTLPGDRKRALDAGCDGFISKPLDVPNFLNQVSSFLPRPNA
jgi:two-component system, cell cycle response regulator DivK